MRHIFTQGLLSCVLASVAASQAAAQSLWAPPVENQRTFEAMLITYQEPEPADSSAAPLTQPGPAQKSVMLTSLPNTDPVHNTQDTCDALSEHCCEDVGGWLYNTQVWFGGEAYKSVGDTNIPIGTATGFMDSAGLVAGFNTGFALGESRIRGQIGGSYGAFDFKGRDTETDAFFRDGSLEQQVFVTAGIYQRSDVCNGERWSWAVVYDQFFGHQWGLFASDVTLGQVRGILGYAYDEHNEIGVWGAAHVGRDLTAFAPVNNAPAVRAMDQANMYWRHNYDLGATTMLYIGALDQASVGSWQFGFLGEAPVNDRLSLYANYTYVVPGSATGPIGSNEVQWDLGIGVVYSFGAKAVSDSVSGEKGVPLLPVANNGSLLITN